MRTCLIAVLLALAPAVAAAQPAPEPQLVEEHRWSITPFLGPGWGEDLDESPLTFGVASAYTWSPRVAFEGEFSYGAFEEELFGIDESVWTLSANALYHFAVRELAPYATVGLGVVRRTADLDTAVGDLDTADTGFGLNLGAGAKARLAERLQLRGDLRYFAASGDAPNFWRFYGGLTFLLGR
ncbi:MAG TPA: porin family protein [Vicinamibacterales bacterium]|nr:porin family protein [Vicinamibacterales bacterium]